MKNLSRERVFPFIRTASSTSTVYALRKCIYFAARSAAPVRYLRLEEISQTENQNMDHEKLEQLHLEVIKDMYANAAARLKEALLEGAPWEAVQEYRHDVTELEIALHNKVRSTTFDPASNADRETV
jgi:hypothetical protein